MIGSGSMRDRRQKQSVFRPTVEVLEVRDLPSISPVEQLFVYELNRARSNPVAYQQETGLPVDLSAVTPRAPLAINAKLAASAQYHTDDMAAHDYFAHQSAFNGLYPNQMARNQGYSLPSAWPDNANYIESLAAGFATPTATLYALIHDSGVAGAGHRVHLLGTSSFFAGHKEIGVGYTKDLSSLYQNYWAIHTAYVNPGDVFLTGVVYNDTNQDGRFSLNEGLGGVPVTAGPYSTITNDAGGWSLKVAAGTYFVSAQGGGFTGTAGTSVAVGANNVEVDFLSGQAAAQVNFASAPLPLVGTVSDQLANRGDTLSIPLPAANTQQTVSWSAAAFTVAAGLDQQLGLTFTGNYSYNLRGAREKYLRGTGNVTYFLLPNGNLYRWTGSLAKSTLIANVGTACYANPRLLWDAPAATVPVSLTINADNLVVTPAADYAGTFRVRLTATSGQTSSTTWFGMTITNHAPELDPVADVTAKTNAGPFTVALQATDADGDSLTYSAQAFSANYGLDQQLGLTSNGNYSTNLRGAREKYLRGTDGQYFLLPGGSLYRWTGSIAGSTFIANVGAASYTDPRLLWNAPAAPVAVSVTVTNNVITINPNQFVGTFSVQAGAADGLANAKQWFQVNLTNQAPELQVTAAAAAAVISAATTSEPTIFVVSASDPDGDLVYVDARAVSLAYALDQSLGLRFTGTYQYNLRGAREKYLRGADGTLYFLRPNGSLCAFKGSIGASTFVAQLDSSVYADPSRLWNAAPGSFSVTISLLDDQLLVDAGGASGFVVELTATDGLTTTKIYLMDFVGA